MSTIVEGTNALSIQVRLNQYLDDLVKQSNVLKKNWDEWDCRWQSWTRTQSAFSCRQSW